MKRICVMCIFPENGNIEDSVLFLAESMKACTERLIIAINGKIGKDIEKVHPISSEIIFRDNVGYDGGAYKDVILQLYNRDELLDYDELILVNDSFWGPLFPFGEMFGCMEKEVVDFWGITRSEAGIILDYEYPQHIQGYFLAIRKKVFIEDRCFRDFWEKFEYPRNYYEAVIHYEIGISKWMNDRGFVSSSYMDLQGADSLVKKNRNVYLDCFDELVTKYRCPILKKKAVGILTYHRYLSLLEHLADYSDYCIQDIIHEVESRDKDGKLGPYKLAELRDFCLSHKKIYVYGYGKYGKAVGKIICRFCDKFSYIVSDLNTSENSPKVIEWEKVTIDTDDGIIIAVGEKLVGEILETVLGKIDISNVLIPKYQ